MSILQLRGQEIHSVFELLGANENDISFSVGWALSRSPAFLRQFFKLVIPSELRFDIDSTQIRLQQYERAKGITDIEIEISEVLYLIIEAKRGWILPSVNQLMTYARRQSFRRSHAATKQLLVLTECSREYAKLTLNIKNIDDVPVVPLSWREIYDCSRVAFKSGTHAEKRLLSELSTYFQRIMTMQKVDSNLVYVVSLASDKPKNWTIAWIDIVADKRRYFHPIGGKGGWPVNPPNHIAFRYNGQLQSIHHVERYEVFTNPHVHFPEIPSQDWVPHYLYFLGPAFAPSKVVRTGKIYRNGRVECMLDTLFTASTIWEARQITKKRLGLD